MCLFLVLCSMTLLMACKKDVVPAHSTATLVPHEARVGLVPFTQPTHVGELLTGALPQKQGYIAKEDMLGLDRMLDTALFQKQRYVVSLVLPASWGKVAFRGKAAPAALAYWLQYGKEHKLDYLVVPQVITWHQRHGGRAGASESAHIRTEMYLLDIRKGRIYGRSIFEEKQVGLLEDISQVQTFFKRGGSWVTAQELTQEAILKGIQELGL